MPTDRQAGRQPVIPVGIDLCRHTYRQTDRASNWNTLIQTDLQLDTQTHIHTAALPHSYPNGQIRRQADRETCIQARESYREASGQAGVHACICSGTYM